MDFLSLFQTNGFIISIGITLLLVGVVVYYFRNKIKYLEHSHMEQAKVLQSFIQKMSLENHVQVTPNTSDVNSLANNTVVDKANMYIDNQYTDKINVSENESDSDSDSDSDSESDSDSDSDNEQKNVVEDVVDQVLEQESNVKKIVIENNEDEDENKDENNDVPDTMEYELEPIVLNVSKAEDNKTMDMEKVPDSVSSSDSESSGSDSDSDNEELSNQDTQGDNDTQEVNKPEQVERVEKNVVKKESSQYSKMKVNALRDLALENKLVESEDDAKKKKKKELVELLSSSTM